MNLDSTIKSGWIMTQPFKPWPNHMWHVRLLTRLGINTNILNMKQVFVWSELLTWVEKEDMVTHVDERIAADTIWVFLISMEWMPVHTWPTWPHVYLSKQSVLTVQPVLFDKSHMTSLKWKKNMLKNKNISQVYTWTCFIFQAAPVTAGNTWATENWRN